MNVLDIIVICIILFFAIKSYRSGLIMSFLSFLPSVVALISTYMFQPVLSGFIRSTNLYANLKNSIGSFLNIKNLISDTALHTQTELINNMNLPDFLKNSLLENNNPVIYNIIDATGIEDYITGLIANMLINILSVIIIFVVTSIAVKIAIKIISTVKKIPVVGALDRFVGLLLGVLQGSIIIWVIGIGLTFFYFNPSFKVFFNLLESSKIANFMYENNILLFMILRIFG